MNTVVLFIYASGGLGHTFECSTQDEQRMAANLIRRGLSLPELTDQQFEELFDLFDLQFQEGTIHIGGLEAVS